MTIDVHALKSALSSKFIGRSTLLGSQLGAAIRDFQPGINFRDEYGGLKQFVTTFLADWVHASSKQGGDDVYVIVGATQDLMSLEEKTETLWPAFSNPRYKGTLFVRAADSKLFYSIGLSEPPESFQSFPRMTKEDYRAIARSYLSNLPDEKKASGEEILAADEFWDEWYEFTSRDSGKATWELFRINAIEASFSQALDASGFSSSASSKWIALLRQSRVGSHPTSAREARAIGLRPSSSSTPRLTNLSASNLLSLAVAEMGEEEARKVFVPIGAIVDALRKSGIG